MRRAGTAAGGRTKELVIYAMRGGVPVATDLPPIRTSRGNGRCGPLRGAARVAAGSRCAPPSSSTPGIDAADGAATNEAGEAVGTSASGRRRFLAIRGAS